MLGAVPSARVSACPHVPSPDTKDQRAAKRASRVQCVCDYLCCTNVLADTDPGDPIAEFRVRHCVAQPRLLASAESTLTKTRLNMLRISHSSSRSRSVGR